MLMTISLSLSFNDGKYLEGGKITQTEEEVGGGDVKYEWEFSIDGGRPPYDAVVKDEKGIILDSMWNFTDRKISGEFSASPNIENVVVEVVDESNQYVSKTFSV